MRVSSRGSRSPGMRRGVVSAPRRQAAGQIGLASLVVSLALLLSSLPAVALSTSEQLRLGPIALLADEPSYVDVGAGIYDLIGNGRRNQTFVGEAELHYGKKFYGVGPAFGLIQNARGGGMAFAAFYSDFALGPVVVTPLAGLGAWWHGGSNDEKLGGIFEFRLSLQAAYQFGNGSRLGLRIGHISNADTQRRNPGENDLMLTYAFPVGF